MTTNWRPQRLDQFVGQEHIKLDLEDEVVVCRQDATPISNRIFYSPPGLGKTTLAATVAAEAGVRCVKLVGKETTLQSLSDTLASLPAEGYVPGSNARNPRAGYIDNREHVKPPILLIDEGDALPRKLWQTLHPIMEGPKPDGSPHIFHGLDHQGKPCKFWVPMLSVWITTNYVGDLHKADVAIFSRCDHPVEFRPYTVEELTQIIRQFAKQTKIRTTETAAELVATRSREVPRNATNLLKAAHKALRAAQVKDRHKSNTVTVEIVERTLAKKGIDEYGLDEMSRQYLRVIGDTHEKRKKGLESIADELGIDAKSVEYVVEPYIRKLGFAEKGSGGRWVTDKGRQAAGLTLHNPASLRAMV